MIKHIFASIIIAFGVICLSGLLYTEAFADRDRHRDEFRFVDRLGNCVIYTKTIQGEQVYIVQGSNCSIAVSN